MSAFGNSAIRQQFMPCVPLVSNGKRNAFPFTFFLLVWTLKPNVFLATSWWTFPFYVLLFIALLYLALRLQIIRSLRRSGLLRLQVPKRDRLRLSTKLSTEFRTVLLVIRSLANEALHDLPEKREAPLRLIKLNSEYLLHLIDQLLDQSNNSGAHPSDRNTSSDEYPLDSNADTQQSPIDQQEELCPIPTYSPPQTSEPKPQKPVKSNQSDIAFMQKVRASILQHLEEETFGVEELAEAIFLSRTQLFRKVKALTGRSVATYIHQVRIERVKDLLSSSDLTVSEIAFRTGFSDPSYLRRIFLKETGETLVAYRDRVRNAR